MAYVIIPLVVEKGTDVPPDPDFLKGRATAIEFEGNTPDALKSALAHLAPEGSKFSIQRSFSFGRLWCRLEGELPPEPLLFVKIEVPSVKLLHYSPMPVRPSKRQKFGALDCKTSRVLLSALIGHPDFYLTEAALNWLSLHLYGASETLEVFLRNPRHERRYYPYARALFKAAAGGTSIQVTDQDGGATEQPPDIQLILSSAEVVPVKVKARWDYGRINDPDSIYSNAESLDQLLRSVLKYNKTKESSYTAQATVVCGLTYLLFFKFHIEKAGRDDDGSLTLLEHAPWFSLAGATGTADLAPVRLLDMDTLIKGKSTHDTLADILPAAPPPGFSALVAFLRTLAGEAAPVVLEYRTADGAEEGAEERAELSLVLAYGPKSCVFSTKRGDTVVKVSMPAYIDTELKQYIRIGPGECPYLRKMVGYGSVSGTNPGLVFLELMGLGVPFKSKHVSSPEKLHKCWSQASTAVDFLHQKHVFHRDIKPDNFIVLDTGKASERLVLHDFDCAANWEEGDLSEDVGTDMFKSPLQREGCDYKCCDDWLSLALSFASVMGLYPREVNDTRKIAVIEALVAKASTPEDMKTRIQSALHQQQACCSCNSSNS